MVRTIEDCGTEATAEGESVGGRLGRLAEEVVEHARRSRAHGCDARLRSREGRVDGRDGGVGRRRVL